MSSYEQQNAKSKQLNSSVQLQSMIEDERKGIAPWLGTLPFCVDLYGDGNYLDHDNIFDFMNRTALSGRIVRFSPVNYPPGTKEESLGSLVRDICMISRANGVELICTGGVRLPISKTLVCSCSIIANKKKELSKENEGPPNYRPETLHHDRKNNRPHGNQNCSRRCTTKRQLSSNNPMCTFRLTSTVILNHSFSKLVALLSFIAITLSWMKMQSGFHHDLLVQKRLNWCAMGDKPPCLQTQQETYSI
jgi:hypothetical protein